MDDTKLMTRPNFGDATIRHLPDGTEKGTGRLRAVDLRDGQYRVAFLMGQLKRKSLPFGANVGGKTFRYWGVDRDLPVDQGRTSACTGFSEATVIMCGPNPSSEYESTEDGDRLGAEIYTGALDRDEWAGNDPCCGSSVRAAAKAARDMELISSFAWAGTVEETAEWLLHHGPAIAGIVWPDAFMDADEHGYLHYDPNEGPLNAVRDGHAIAIVGVNKNAKNPDGTVGFFEFLNSWGRGWGIKGSGRVRVSFPLFGNLLMADGEVCCPTKQTLQPVMVPKGKVPL